MLRFILNDYWEPLDFELPNPGGAKANGTNGADGSIPHSTRRLKFLNGTKRRSMKAKDIVRHHILWWVLIVRNDVFSSTALS
jgi:hypothetical protein